MVDDDQQCLPISVYNLSQGSGVKIGDSVSIPEPYLQTINKITENHGKELKPYTPPFKRSILTCTDCVHQLSAISLQNKIAEIS
jgi:hypothetical protein